MRVDSGAASGQTLRMAGFRRVFNTFPGYNVLGSIESVNVVDVPPPATPLGAGVGVACIVGEFEDGPLEAPTQIQGGSDLLDTFGGLGHVKSGAPYAYPVARRSGGASQVWEGSGFVHLYGLRFAGLIVCRVDNSAGTVLFSRQAYSDGETGPWDLEPGQTVDVSVDGGGAVTATFLATAGAITGTAGTYPTGFVGGETIEIKVDELTSKVVFFTAAEQTLVQVVARINAVMAMTIASDSGGQLRLSSFVRGYAGRIEVVSGTALATLGLPAAPTPAVWTWTFLPPAVANNYQVRVTQTINGVSTNYDSGIFAATGAETNTQFRDGVFALLAASPGVTYATSGAADITATGVDNLVFSISEVLDPNNKISFTNTTPAVLTVAVGTGNVASIDRVQQAEAIALLEPLTGVGAGTSPTGLLRVRNTATPLSGTIQVLASSTADLGFDNLVHSAIPSADSTVPAGTLVRDPTTGTLWITLLDAIAAATTAAAVRAKVRPATDDDTALASAANGITELVDALADAWTVDNDAAVTRLNAFQMDVRYEAAIAKTLNVSGVPFAINVIYAARSTATINRALAANALDATNSGHRARKAVLSPPVGTSRVDAKAGPISVAANRSERVFYLFPGVKIRLGEIASLGVVGGVGFTADGVIQVPSHGMYASVRSILAPEENVGQQLADTNYGPMSALGLEDLYDPASGLVGAVNLQQSDYEDFKAKGIIGPRLDRTAGMVFQSDITSVDPAINPVLADAKRRWMGDFIIDSLMDIGVKYVKKLNTPARRQSLLVTVNNFLDLLRSRFQPDASRIEDFFVADTTSEQLRALGFQTISVKVRLFPSMDFIVFTTEVGTTVTVTQQ